jgi:hypothetical protein
MYILAAEEIKALKPKQARELVETLQARLARVEQCCDDLLYAIEIIHATSDTPYGKEQVSQVQEVLEDKLRVQEQEPKDMKIRIYQ